MSTDPLRAAIEAAADAVEAARDELGRLDAVAGDGDHGMTMSIGARAVRAKLAELPEATGAELLTQVALAMGSVGGAIGPIYATALIRMAGTLRGLAAGPAPTVVARATACAEAAETAIGQLGGAKPGDKTILDALHPAVEALRLAESRGADLAPALREAAAAARAGAESTAGMVATVGRASRLGERSRGSPDAGATSLAIIVEAVAGAV